MPRKLKVVDVNAETASSSAAEPKASEAHGASPLPVVTEQSLDATTIEVPIEPEPPVEATEVPKKKTRAPRAPRQKKEEPIAEAPMPDIPEEPKAEEAPEPVQEQEAEHKSIKTVELVECPDCHKKVTARTLKYSHQAVCPAKNPPPAAATKSKKKTQPVQEEEVEHIPVRSLVAFRRPRSQRYAHLVSQAF